MRISIAISTYNGEKYLSDLLESLVSQTRLPDEIIICDDASSDRTLEIIRKYKNMNRKISWITSVNDGNLGWKKISGMP